VTSSAIIAKASRVSWCKAKPSLFGALSAARCWSSSPTGAGFTGCATDDIEITNVNARANGSGTWNATCKDKVYLCSQGSTEGHASTYSCAVTVN